ncbi:histone H2A.N [Physeter macrocephalus]|uniref:Histone H2A.N n=1 Tax=Physeter macrocephalus TaxID=9755 RepID=A0A9W2X2U0_PHYMC|nr:histone H2A.N [Physeter catodon]
MHFTCLRGLRFPKKKPIIYIPAKEKDERASSAFGKTRRKKKEAYFSYTGEIPKPTHPDFSGCSWILDALGALEDWWLERVSLEAVRLSLYSHRRTVTSREILEAVKQRCSRKSLGINETLRVPLPPFPPNGPASARAREPPVGSLSHSFAAARAFRGPNPRPARGPGGDGGAW